MKELRRCQVCRSYTLNEVHCGKESVSPKPAKWSPDDKWGKYRLEAKKSLLKEKGLIPKDF